jgi:hypothetical protein
MHQNSPFIIPSSTKKTDCLRQLKQLQKTFTGKSTQDESEFQCVVISLYGSLQPQWPPSKSAPNWPKSQPNIGLTNSSKIGLKLVSKLAQNLPKINLKISLEIGPGIGLILALKLIQNHPKNWPKLFCFKIGQKLA